MVFDVASWQLGVTFNLYPNRDSIEPVANLLEFDPNKWHQKLRVHFPGNAFIIIPSWIMIRRDSMGEYSRKRINDEVVYQLEIQRVLNASVRLDQLTEECFLDDVIRDWKSLPENYTRENLPTFVKFFETYGTHMIREVPLGRYVSYEMKGRVEMDPTPSGLDKDNLPDFSTLCELQQAMTQWYNLVPIPHHIREPRFYSEILHFWELAPFAHDKNRARAINAAFTDVVTETTPLIRPPLPEKRCCFL